MSDQAVEAASVPATPSQAQDTPAATANGDAKTTKPVEDGAPKKLSPAE